MYIKIERLGGGGSDYAAFVQHIGVASADISYGAGNKHIACSDVSISILLKSINPFTYMHLHI